MTMKHLHRIKKAILFFSLALTAGTAKAQVTIGSNYTPNQNALLELRENADNSSTKGLLLPRVALTSTTSASPMTAFSSGMIVYNTATAGTSPTNVIPGFYVSDGTKWIGLGEGGSNWYLSGATTDAGKDKTNTMYRTGAIGIGTITPDSSAILDMSGVSDKGMLAPKVALSSNTDQTTVKSPSTGLLIYNTGTAGLSYQGYVFWNGTNWMAMNSGSLNTGTIEGITCDGVILSPSTYTTGTYYAGTMSVPYIGGNGGVFLGQTIGPVNGLTATLTGGNFANGAGSLTYAVSGTPTVNSPTTTSFNINIGGQTCTAVVGAGDGIAKGELVYYHGTISYADVKSKGYLTSTFLISEFLTDLPLLNKSIRVDAQINGAALTTDGASTYMNPRVYNVTANNVKMWLSEMSTHTGDSRGGNHVILANTYAPNNYIQYDDGVYLTRTRNETVTFDITTTDYKWYRVYQVIRIDNKVTTPKSTTSSNTSADNAYSTDTDATDNTIEVYVSIQRLF